MSQSIVRGRTIVVTLLCVAMAHAAGAPQKNVTQGVFSAVDSVAHTAVFSPVGSDDTLRLFVAENLDAGQITIGTRVLVSIDKRDGRDVITDVSTMFLGLTIAHGIALLVIGFIGGMLSGFIGSGGAFVLTPSMMSLGVPAAVAVASNMCHKFPKALVGAYKRYRYGQVDIALGLLMALSAIVGVQIGIRIQKSILNTWGNAGSNLYVSVVFVVILIIVGGYVLYDAWKLARGQEEPKTPRLARALQKVNIPPMIEFKTAGIRMSAWITVPVGLATGMLAATIAVGGFIGVPGMIYLMGVSALVASATELVVAFVMGLWGSIQWGLSGLIDIRLTLLLLAGSLVGVQLGALGTTYVKDYLIKLVMGIVMLIVVVSRGAKVPGYLADLGVFTVGHNLRTALDAVSFWALVAALVTAGIIISVVTIRGMMQAAAKRELP